ncbi:MAG: hypothetical protein KAR20_24200, partial [Candidatus Heimdallarchaeota archaeon]|nr:hypothetical protein [Candidatus Heimdallarchaeota archaeon]
KRAVGELKEGLDLELKQYLVLRLLNVWNVDLSNNKTELLKMLHKSAEFFGRKKSRASKNKKQRMAELAEQSVVSLSKFEFEENVEQDLRKLIEGENLQIRIYAADLLFRFNPVIAKDALMKAYGHYATRSIAKKYVEKYNQKCCMPVFADEGLEVAKSALSDELAKTEHFGKVPDEIDLIEELSIVWLKTEKDIRTFLMTYQFVEEQQVFPAAVKVFDAMTEKTEVHISKNSSLFDLPSDEIVECFVGKAYFDRHFAEIIPEDADDAEVEQIEEFLQQHQEIFDALYSPENLQIFKNAETGEIYAAVQAYELEEIEKSALIPQGEDEFDMEIELDEDEEEIVVDDDVSEINADEDTDEPVVEDESTQKTFGELVTQARIDGESVTNEEYFNEEQTTVAENVEIDNIEEDLVEETVEESENEVVAFPAVIILSGGKFLWEDISESADITCEIVFHKFLGEQIAKAIETNTEYNFKLG